MNEIILRIRTILVSFFDVLQLYLDSTIFAYLQSGELLNVPQVLHLRIKRFNNLNVQTSLKETLCT